jgi:predicted nucleotidyltransferase
MRKRKASISKAQSYASMSPEIEERIRKIGERLKKEYRAERVILFGSYARGVPTQDSDVDLFIIAPTKERFFHRMATVRRLIRDLRDGLPVAPIVLTAKELEKRRAAEDPFIEEVLDTGIPL